MKKEVYTHAYNSGQSAANLNFKFHRKNMTEHLLAEVYKRFGMGGKNDGQFGATIYERPMVNGILQDGFEDDMVFMWD